MCFSQYHLLLYKPNQHWEVYAPLVYIKQALMSQSLLTLESIWIVRIQRYTSTLSQYLVWFLLGCCRLCPLLCLGLSGGGGLWQRSRRRCTGGDNCGWSDGIELAKIVNSSLFIYILFTTTSHNSPTLGQLFYTLYIYITMLSFPSSVAETIHHKLG